MYEKLKKKKLNSKNSGYTLVELIVVIAILLVLTGVATITFAMVARANVGKMEKKVEAALDETRNKSMSIEANWVCIVSNEGGTIYVTIKDIFMKSDGSSTEQVYYREKVTEDVDLTYISDLSATNTNYSTLDDGQTLEFRFGKKSGKCTVTVPTGATAPTERLTFMFKTGNKMAGASVWCATGRIEAE